jgi:D-threo-aldose 1-dehydrogenase
VELCFTELGFGGAPLGNLYRPLTEREARLTLDAVWATGCRYFDTAPTYGLGLSETRLNCFLREKPRGAFLISTKVGRLLELCAPHARPNTYFEVPSRCERFDYSYDGVMRSLEFSLERLGLDSIDIVFIHDVDTAARGPCNGVQPRLSDFMNGGYRALDALRAAGAVKAIGAGLDDWQAAEAFAHAADFDVFMLAGRYTLLEQDALTSFLPLCQQKGIGVIVGGPFNSGILATGLKAEARYNTRAAPTEVKTRVQRIHEVCKAFGVKLPEAALRFPLGHPAVVSVAPGVQRASEAKRNAQMMMTKIPAALWRTLKTEKLIRDDAPIPK